MDFDVPAESPADRSELRRTDEAVVQTASDRPSDPDSRPEGRRENDFEEREVAHRREIERLEAEIERKEERLRCVTERYENLLAEKNRKLADESGSDSDADRRTTLRSRLARFLRSLR